MAVFEQGSAVVVGISDYQFLSSLPAVTGDVARMHDVLVGSNTCAYSPDKVELLRDNAATKSGILSAISRLAQRCDESSTAIFFLSGHGGRLEFDPEECFICPFEARADTDDSIRRTCISSSEFSAAWAQVTAAMKVVVLDCCHANGTGSAAVKSLRSGVLKTGIAEQLLNTLGVGKGQAVLSSSQADELSFILEGDKHSLFTKYLLEGLGGGIDSQDGLIRVFDLFDYVSVRVPPASGGHQHPVFKCEVGNNFPIAFWRGGAKNGRPRSAPNPSSNLEEELMQFGIGPMVLASDMPLEIIGIFAKHFAANQDKAPLCLAEAMRTRRSLNPEGYEEEAIIVSPGEIPTHRSGLENYWSAALLLAGQKSRRTLASIFLVPSAPRAEFLHSNEAQILREFMDWLKHPA